MNTIITIGREFGSGGRELGRRLAEELGYEYYDKETEDKNVAECIIAKQRNGPVGTVKLAWLGQFSKFGNLEFNHN